LIRPHFGVHDGLMFLLSPLKKVLSYNLKIADLLVTTSWSQRPYAEFWPQELIVTHPVRLFLNWLFPFSIVVVAAAAGWIGVGLGIVYTAKGLSVQVMSEIFRGLFVAVLSFVMACLCTAYMTKHIRNTAVLLLLFWRGKNTSGQITWTQKTRGGTPMSPVFNWHIKVNFTVTAEDHEPQNVLLYGRTTLSGLHDILETGLELNQTITIRYDPKDWRRARVVYS
jgi:hypothetical protein